MKITLADLFVRRLSTEKVFDAPAPLTRRYCSNARLSGPPAGWTMSVLDIR